jgi:Protein kinase domain
MTDTEILVKKTAWLTLPGVILDGGFELKGALATGETSATFGARILGAGGQEATVSFYQADLAQAEEQLSFWQTLREWPHPNLSTPLAAGYRWLGDTGVVYLVLPIPDEKLSGVLRERALDADEAAELVRSVASALGHLHACGLAHGNISPETVLATRDAVQLSTDAVRRQGAELLITPPPTSYLAPESDRQNNTTAADIWGLGATLFEVLTRRHYKTGRKEQLNELPFSLLLHKCLEETVERRCSLAEALEIFAKGPGAALPAPAPAPQPVPVVEPTAAEVPVVEAAKLAPEPPAPPASALPKVETVAAASPVVEEKPKATQTGAAARVAAADEARKAASNEAFKKKAAGASSILAAPVPAESRHKPISKRKPVAAKIKQIEAGLGFESAEVGEYTGDAVNQPKSKPRLWQFAVVGLAVVAMLTALVFLVIIPKLEAPIDQSGPIQTPPAAGAKANAWQTKTLAPPADLAKVADARTQPGSGDGETPAEIAGGQADDGTNNWRLVLYAFEDQHAADRRLEMLNKNHPGLDAHVFLPVARGPYLIVMGGAMSHESATELKKKAIQQGLPRAIHIQSF